MKRYLIIGALCVVPMFAVECTESQQQSQMDSWQALGDLMEQNIVDTEMQLHLVKDPIQRAGIAAKLAKAKEIAAAYNSTLDTIVLVPVDDPAPGDSGAAAIEGALAAAAGLTGGLSLLGIPLVRLFRQRRMIFKAIDAGGGVVDATAAKMKLLENAGAWKALQKHQANGGVPASVTVPVATIS